jgi:hypothetical protein
VGVRNAAFPAIVALAILVFAVSKPAWLIVERTSNPDYGRTPLMTISHAERENYASIAEALLRADEIRIAHPNTTKSVSRINKNEAYRILDFIRSQNLDRSSKRVYIQYNGRLYHAMLQFQYERPQLVD